MATNTSSVTARNKEEGGQVTCKLRHHGAAASSCPNVIAWIPPTASSSWSSSASKQNGSGHEASSSTNCSTLVYASHGLVNLSRQVTIQPSANGNGDDGSGRDDQETIWNVTETLRTATVGTDDRKRTITALAYIANPESTTTSTKVTVLATGFSDGTITVWMRNLLVGSAWIEFVVGPPPPLAKSRSITALDALWMSENHIALVTGSSAGAHLYIVAVPTDEQQHQQQHQQQQDEEQAASAVPFLTRRILDQPLLETNCIGAVRLLYNEQMGFIVLLGTASPRHNRIHLYHRHHHDYLNDLQNSSSTHDTLKVQHVGSLSGHEDWISCMAWSIGTTTSSISSSSLLLASGSQDCRIRLWKFTTTAEAISGDIDTTERMLDVNNVNDDDDVSSSIASDDGDEEDEEGESRLEIHHVQQKTVTRVTLEALLMGHEERVTAVCWHPQPHRMQLQSYDDDDENGAELLISSSMDRSIFLWSPSREDGIWTPLTRVGSAGGILGGSVGSTLLGYLNVAIEPVNGRCLVGHAYGGSLHVWRCDNDDGVEDGTNENENETSTATATALPVVQWRAQPCLTGHFDGVTDLCWEASAGDYLLTVSNDQTCRLWAPVARAQSSDDNSIKRNPVWVELARPQVHGYNLSAVASLSTTDYPHLLVTGADEKELRAFDAPLSTIRTLKGMSALGSSATIGDGNSKNNNADPIHRVDRAYIPSLGLSNRATAADAAEEDVPFEEAHDGKDASLCVRLPLERDLGAVSLWPEIRKLYGHDTELYCLASTLAARTACTPCYDKSPSPVVLVASSCKARTVEDAAIRLWNVAEGKCHQVLKGGHKSTVATLAFSPDGRFLASSGKDRRLCLWQRNDTSNEYELAWAKDVAHKRIVWSVHFLPWKLPNDTTGTSAANPHILASGSRDGCIKIWSTRETSTNSEASTDSSSVALEELMSFAPACFVNGKPDAVTSLAFGPKPCQSSSTSSALLAVGLESGRLELWKVPITTATDEAASHTITATLALSLPPSQCHLATITKLAWKPMRNNNNDDTKDDDNEYVTLASSSMDHGVRVYQIRY